MAASALYRLHVPDGSVAAIDGGRRALVLALLHAAAAGHRVVLEVGRVASAPPEALSCGMPSDAHIATVDLLAPGRDPARPRVQVLARAVAPDPEGRPRWRHEILVDRGDGQPERFALTLPAEVVGIVGAALVEVAREGAR